MIKSTRLKRQCVFLLALATLHCGLLDAQDQNSGDASMPTLTESLPEVDSKQASRVFAESDVISREIYGRGNGKVETPTIFKTNDPITVEAGENDITISPQDPEQSRTDLSVSRPDFPITIDFKMRMNIEKNGFVRLFAFIPRPDDQKQRTVCEIFISPAQIRDVYGKQSIPAEVGSGVQTYRLVFDELGRGRLYVLGSDSPSLPIQGKEDMGTYSSIELFLKNSKISLEEISIYRGLP